MDLRLRGTLADAEDRRDLTVLKTFDVVQHKRCPRPLRKPRNRPFEVQFADGSMRSWLAAHRRRGVFFVERSRRAACSRLPAFEVIEAAIHGQAVEPGADRRLASKVRKLSIRQQEDLLKQIFRVGPGAAHPPGEVEKPRRMLLIELLESWHVSFTHSARLDEVGLGRVAHLAPLEDS